MESNAEYRWKALVTKVLEERVHRARKARYGLTKTEHCDHPTDSIVNGANQYGSWQRCLMCQTKLSYTPHRTKPEKAAAKTKAYVSTPPPQSVPKGPASSDTRGGGGPHDRGSGQGHGGEQPPAPSGYGRVQPASPHGHGRKQPSSHDRHDGNGTDHADDAGDPTRDDGGSEELGSGILGDNPFDPDDPDSDGERQPRGGPGQSESDHGVVVPVRNTRTNGIHRAGDGCFYTLLDQGCPGGILEAFREGSARIERAVHRESGETRDLVKWRLQGFANYLYNEDLEDDYHVSLTNRDKKKLRRAMRELTKERMIASEKPRNPVVLEVFGAQNLEQSAADMTDELEVVAFRQGRNWDFRQWKHRASFWRVVENFKPDLVILDPTLSGVPGRSFKAGAGRSEAVCDQAIFDFCVNVAREQLRLGRRFFWECPMAHGSSDDFESWTPSTESLCCEDAGVPSREIEWIESVVVANDD